jgi:hypothetical protein
VSAKGAVTLAVSTGMFAKATEDTYAHAQNVPSTARVAAGALGFCHAFDGPDLYGALSFFETMPSRPSLQMALNISTPPPSVYSMY